MSLSLIFSCPLSRQTVGSLGQGSVALCICKMSCTFSSDVYYYGYYYPVFHFSLMFLFFQSGQLNNANMLYFVHVLILIKKLKFWQINMIFKICFIKMEQNSPLNNSCAALTK